MIDLLEFDGMEKSYEMYKAFLTVIKDGQIREFDEALEMWSVTQLRLLCYIKFQSNPILSFGFTQCVISKLLYNVADVRNQLGEILEELEANIIEVALTDVAELIHNFDMKLDDYDFIRIMANWIYLLKKINQPQTQLHTFVNRRLAEYVQENKENPKPWKYLQTIVKQWEQYHHTEIA